MPTTESQLVMWTLESNEHGTWALFLRVAGVPHQMTPWQSTRDAVLEVFAKALSPDPE